MICNRTRKVSYLLLVPQGTLGTPPGELNVPEGSVVPFAPLLSALLPPVVTTALPWMLLESVPVLPLEDPITGELAYAAASLKSSIDVPNISFFNKEE